MRGDLLVHEVIPFFLSLALLAVAALGVDAALHLLDVVWVGRYLGIPGLLLIIASFSYSLAKRKIITVSRPLQLLRLHEWMAWAGSLLILVHAGIHFNAILPWLAIGAMLVNIASGLTGKYLLKRARRRLEETTQRISARGLSSVELEERLHWDSLTFDFVRKWRAVHYPITLAFAVLATAHLLSIFYFWSWR